MNTVLHAWLVIFTDSPAFKNLILFYIHWSKFFCETLRVIML